MLITNPYRLDPAGVYFVCRDELLTTCRVLRYNGEG